MSQQLLKENVLKFIESRILSSEKEDQAVYFLSQEVALILPKVLGKMSKEVQQKFIDLLDKECPALSLQSMEHIKKLGRVCSEIGLLPTSIVASGRIITDEMSITSGGATDFWKGKLDGKLVAIKAFRAFSKLSPDRLEAAKKIIWELVPVWKKLVHRNVSPFCGVDVEGFQLSLVYELGKDGNIRAYAKERDSGQRLKLLLQVAEGLKYLHDLDIIHGRVKATNVIIQNGVARLTEYGLHPILSNPDLSRAEAERSDETPRWLAPEMMVLRSQGDKQLGVSKPTDVFAFAMVIVEVFTGEVPWGQSMKVLTVIKKITDGERPKRPAGVSDAVWNFLQECWIQDLQKRPEIGNVVENLKVFVRSGGSSTR